MKFGEIMAEAVTGISKTIDQTEQTVQYDASVKRLLAEKVVLAWILKECVEEFAQIPVDTIIKEAFIGEPEVAVTAVDQDELDADAETADKRIEGGNTEDKTLKEGTVYFDIRFTAKVPGTDKPVQLIINVEAQKSSATTYPLIKRAIYYVSRLISAQKNTVFVKSHYEQIRKVYSIWIQMSVSDEDANSITEYAIAETNTVGNVKRQKADYDLLKVVMIGLGKGDKAEKKSILQLLDVLLSKEMRPDEKKQILEADFDIPMTRNMSQEVQTMCNLGEGIYEEATIDATVKHVRRLMKNMNLSAQEAMDALDVSDEDREYVSQKVEGPMAVV